MDNKQNKNKSDLSLDPEYENEFSDENSDEVDEEVKEIMENHDLDQEKAENERLPLRM
jgi:hypothetical protein